MENLYNKKEINSLAALLTVTYMVSYITRINYGAVISEMVSSTGISKSMLSMALTGSFVTYGAGQLVSGALGDRFSSKKLVCAGLLITVCMNFLITLTLNPYIMLVLWCVNGFAQSLMWPPMVRIMSDRLSEEDYKRVCTRVQLGSSLGTVVVYSVSPLLIALIGWKAVFVASACVGFVMLIEWNRKCADTPVVHSTRNEKSGENTKAIFTPSMLAVLLAIIFMGMLRDGVTTWMPSYVSETYQLSSVVAILTGVAIPLVSIAFFYAAEALHMKFFKNPVKLAGIIFAVGAVFAALTAFTTGKSAVCSILFTSILTGCMHGVNLMLIGMTPNYFKKYGNVATVSGILNSCTYIGAAISTYGIAVISEKSWSFTVFSWVITALLGAVVCLLCASSWGKRFMKD